MPFGSHLTVGPLPSGNLRRPARHYPRFWIWHPSSGHQRDFNPPDLCAARRTHYGGSDSCSALLSPHRSPYFTCTTFLTIPSLPTPCAPIAAFARYPSVQRLSRFHRSRLRQTHKAVSISSSYGLVVYLLLFPTLPRGDAVTVGYRPESACLERTFTSLTMHARRRTRNRPM